MAKIPRVALLIETSRTYTRSLLRGIKRFISENGRWSVFLELRARDSRLPAWLRSWDGDGILCRSFNQEGIDAIASLGVPAVELRAAKLQHTMPFAGVDNQALGALVAEHLIERGFRHFGCYELDIEVFFEERRNNFVNTLAEHGFDCHCLRSHERSEITSEWEEQQQVLVDWIRHLPKPIGIMACTDQLGFWLLDACSRAGVAVPEDVAVVGVEDDESLCEMATPSMSSVHFPGARIGYEAAALLARMMAGEPGPSAPILIPPTGIVVRQSSDIIAVDDPVVAKALRWIRENAHLNIRVADVSSQVDMSRSTLERRMKRLLGRSPQEEISRVRLRMVKELLAETDLTLERIAHRTGFAHVQYMVELFRNRFGVTPGQYRKKVRLPKN